MAGRLPIAVFGAVAACSLAACGGGGSTTIHTGSGTITVHSGNGSAEFKSSGVTEAVAGSGGSVSLPSGFPGSVPLPKNGTLRLAATTGGQGYQLIYRYPTASAANAALEAYDSALRSAGYTEGSSVSDSSGTQLQGWNSGQWSLSITVGPTGSSPASEFAISVDPSTAKSSSSSTTG